MNTVSLFLYLSDIIQKFAIASFTIVVAFGAFIAASWLCRALTATDVHSCDLPNDNNPHGNRDYRVWYGAKNLTEKKLPYCIFALAMVITALIPSQKTMYMIAASEVSGMAVQSEIGQEIVQDIRSALKNILKGE